MNTYRKVARGATAANVILAANVYQQDELRGAKEVIRSFAASTKSGEGCRRKVPSGTKQISPGAEPGSPTRADFARVGVVEPGSPACTVSVHAGVVEALGMPTSRLGVSAIRAASSRRWLASSAVPTCAVPTSTQTSWLKQVGTALV